MNRASAPHDGDFRPTASLECLRLRARLLAAARDFFHRHGYWEVETPLLSHDVLVDAHLEPFGVHRSDAPTTEGTGPRPELFLQTSPEFAMKRLLAAGAQSIYQITRAFRRGEVGRLHNPEFTLLEWYRVGDTYYRQMQFTEDLVRWVFRSAADDRRECTTGTDPVPHAKADRSGTDSDGSPPFSPQCASLGDENRPFERLSYDEAFERYAGTRVLHRSASQLAELAQDRGVTPPPGLRPDDRDGWLNLLLAELVEPHLGTGHPVFLYDYPASQAALARVRPGVSAQDPPVAERFELYLRGIEVCNGYHELTDADELRQRLRRQSTVRQREGRRPLPRKSRLLDAMDHGLPPCAGVALGFDRLVMLAAGAHSLAEVTPFPFDRA